MRRLSEEGICKIRSKGGKRGTWKDGQFLQRARGAKNRDAEKGSETNCKSCNSLSPVVHIKNPIWSQEPSVLRATEKSIGMPVDIVRFLCQRVIVATVGS